MIKHMNNSFGLKPGDLESIVAIIGKYPEIEEAIIFGSRAKGNFKNGSDVDIAIKGPLVNFRSVAATSYLLNEETLMPYQFDVVNYRTIKNIDLINHINRVGISFYKKAVVIT